MYKIVDKEGLPAKKIPFVENFRDKNCLARKKDFFIPFLRQRLNKIFETEIFETDCDCVVL